MKVKNLLAGFFLLGISILSSSRAAAQMLEGEFSLRGLKSVSIVTEDINRFDSTDGLSGKLITDDVEKKLKEAGIEILTNGQDAPGSPYLHVNINYLKKNGFYNASIEVSLNQEVMLRRDPSIKISSITWLESELISGEEKSVGADIRKYLIQIIDKFVYEWKLANPSKSIPARSHTTSCSSTMPQQYAYYQYS